MFEVIKVKIKSLDKMISEYGSDWLGVKTTPQFNIFMESWVPKDRIMNVAKAGDNLYLLGMCKGTPYYISCQHIEEIIEKEEL